MSRIALPKEMYSLSPARGGFFFLYATLMWVLPAFAIYGMLKAGAPIYALIPISAVAAIVGGYGVLLAGFVGHDGIHFSLHPNKTISVILGILATAPLVVIVEMGFALSHWRHHQHLGGESDPDVQIFGKFRSFWLRALLARPVACNVYSKNAICYVLGIGPKYVFPLPAARLRVLTAFNLLACGIFLGLHIALFLVNPLLEISFLMVLLSGSVISGLSPYIEHAGTENEHGYETRTATGLWWDVFLFGNNYHIEHHLYPNLPAYRLKAAYQYLRGAGYYDGRRPLSHGLIDTYRFTSGRYIYGNEQKKRA